jgi:hypothetical protein
MFACLNYKNADPPAARNDAGMISITANIWQAPLSERLPNLDTSTWDDDRVTRPSHPPLSYP